MYLFHLIFIFVCVCVFLAAFETGHDHQAKTKGIWVMCLSHPTQKTQVLVLLDSEGLDDVLKVRSL